MGITAQNTKLHTQPVLIRYQYGLFSSARGKICSPGRIPTENDSLLSAFRWRKCRNDAFSQSGGGASHFLARFPLYIVTCTVIMGKKYANGRFFKCRSHIMSTTAKDCINTWTQGACLPFSRERNSGSAAMSTFPFLPTAILYT